LSGKSSHVLNVFLHNKKPLLVGRLAYINQRIFFEFDADFPQQHLNLSPFNLEPSSNGGAIPGPDRLFEGLHGLFNDSLPDGWGRLLMDRKLRELNIRPSQMTPLDRLSWIGSRGFGALTYEPEKEALFRGHFKDEIDLDQISRDSLLVLEDKAEKVFDYLLEAGGSPHGASPKAIIGLSHDRSIVIHGRDELPEGYEHWLVKFPTQKNNRDIGLVEQAYADMARHAGIHMNETLILPSNVNPGFFGTRRFDRMGNKRVHMHTLCGLLHADHRLPSVGYEELIKVTHALTRKREDIEQVFTRMVFNVLAHNQDDHTKNHSFLMDDRGEWSLSPAYDIVFSDGPGGEHSLDVAGEGKCPTVEHFYQVGESVGLDKKTMDDAISDVQKSIDHWPDFAGAVGVSKAKMTEIKGVLNDLL